MTREKGTNELHLHTVQNLSAFRFLSGASGILGRLECCIFV